MRNASRLVLVVSSALLFLGCSDSKPSAALARTPNPKAETKSSTMATAPKPGPAAEAKASPALAVPPPGEAQKSGTPKDAVASTKVSASKAQALAAYIENDVLVTIDAQGTVRSRLKAEALSEAHIAVGSPYDQLLIATEQHIVSVDWKALELVPVAQLPKEVTVPNEMGEIPMVQSFTRLRDGQKACLGMKRGDPNIPGDDGEIDYAEWTYLVTLKDGAVKRQACPSAAKTGQSKMKTAAPALRLVTGKEKCGLYVDQTFFPLARASARNEGVCDIALQPALPSGRFQPVYADLGGDDAMQHTYVIYLIDRTKKTLVPMSPLRAESDETPRYYADEKSPEMATADFGWVVVEDMENPTPGVGDLPWVASQSLDVLRIQDRLMNLNQAPPRVVTVPLTTVFLR